MLKYYFRKEDIERKRTFFNRLCPSTDEFLTFMNDTYISDYVSDRVVINNQTGFTESNVVEIMANVENYQKCMDQFGVESQRKDKFNDILVNKDIEKLKNEMRAKLDAFKKDNYIGTFKLENKGNNVSYDETIKRMADELVKVVNSQNHPNRNQNNLIEKKKK